MFQYIALSEDVRRYTSRLCLVCRILFSSLSLWCSRDSHPTELIHSPCSSLESQAREVLLYFFFVYVSAAITIQPSSPRLIFANSANEPLYPKTSLPLVVLFPTLFFPVPVQCIAIIISSIQYSRILFVHMQINVTIFSAQQKAVI